MSKQRLNRIREVVPGRNHEVSFEFIALPLMAAVRIMRSLLAFLISPSNQHLLSTHNFAVPKRRKRATITALCALIHASLIEIRIAVMGLKSRTSQTIVMAPLIMLLHLARDTEWTYI